jgi:hypothetical protein
VVSPQGRPFAHVAGQLSVPPQLSPTSPQYCCTLLALLQVVFWQSGPPTHTLLVHVQPLPAAEQSVPQSSEWPQLSPTVPQYWPPAATLQDTGVQTSFGPLHKPVSQSHPLLLHAFPQFTDDPQLSPSTPQYWSLFAVRQASGVQLARGSALHRPLSHTQLLLAQVVPQCTVDPHPSPMSPQY